ncbi:hypothetical protein RND71_039376 [Anisodus tanguticus]|uniref:Uncharacterized protein n=1 Tax=Anisodus tanguticus TaxID=243964 RepID=A0AAE1QWH7_9SOLA|nr:hypothetical protein RND71_039376 [Anisodus tanguticus]
MADLAKIGKILGFSLLEGRNNKERQSTNEETKQACVYRYYPHTDLVQVLPVSSTEARVVYSGYEMQKAPALAC